MEKRKVTMMIGGHPLSFYSDDPDEYISDLEQRANAIMKQTAEYSGSSAYMNAILAVLFLADKLLRAEQKKGKKNTARAAGESEDNGQVSMWDLLDDR